MTRITLQRVGYSEQHSQIISGSRFSRAKTNNGKMFFFVVFHLRGKEKLVKLEYNEFGSVNRCCRRRLRFLHGVSVQYNIKIFLIHFYYAMKFSNRTTVIKYKITIFFLSFAADGVCVFLIRFEY